VDLNSTAAFSRRNLLILQEAESAKTATSADLSFSFIQSLEDHNLSSEKDLRRT
jgi:hypothetical protein